MRYIKTLLTFRRLPGKRILIEVWFGSCLWRSRTVPEEENFASLLNAVAEIDRDLDGKFDYFEDSFLPEVMRKVESIRRGIQQVLAEKAS